VILLGGRRQVEFLPLHAAIIAANTSAVRERPKTPATESRQGQGLGRDPLGDLLENRVVG
jgi:hypothetical protein